MAAGYPPEHVQVAVERLCELGIVDDDRLAAALIESRDRSRPRGNRALFNELRQRGIPDEVAQRLMDERAARARGPEGGSTDAPDSGAGAEERAARTVLAKLRPRGGDPRHESQRVAQALARRGFPPDLCWALAREFVTNNLQEPAEAMDADVEAPRGPLRRLTEPTQEA